MTSPQEVTIRAALPEEADKLSGLAMRAKSHWAYSAQTLERWRAELAVHADDVRARPMFVATIGPEIAGFCSLRPSDRSWELDNLWVEPDFMHRGIGRALLRHAMAIATHAGASEIVIDSDPHAEAFYLSCGAVRRGQVAAPTSEEPHRVRPQLLLVLERASEQ